MVPGSWPLPVSNFRSKIGLVNCAAWCILHVLCSNVPEINRYKLPKGIEAMSMSKMESSKVRVIVINGLKELHRQVTVKSIKSRMTVYCS